MGVHDREHEHEHEHEHEREHEHEHEHPCAFEAEEDRFWNRRAFLGASGALAAAAAGGWVGEQSADGAPRRPGKEPPEPRAPEGFTPWKASGRIVEITHPNAMLNMRRLNKPIVEKMVNQALLDLTGASSPAEAMSRFIHKNDVVGIHPNCLGSPYMGANPAVTYTIVRALLEMGLPEKNIIIYDQYGGRMRRVGYRLKDQKNGIKVLSHRMWGYEHKPTFRQNGRPVRFCNVIKRVTAVINIPVPKDHDLAGVTGALKNMAFGNILRVPQFHRGIHQNIADIYNHPMIKDKVRLHVVDALRCLYQGGPQDRGPHKGIQNSILATTDPVTADVAILDIVNKFRVAKRMKRIEDVRWPRKRPPLSIAAAAKLGLGTDDRAKIQWSRKSGTGIG